VRYYQLMNKIARSCSLRSVLAPRPVRFPVELKLSMMRIASGLSEAEFATIGASEFSVLYAAGRGQVRQEEVLGTLRCARDIRALAASQVLTANDTVRP
jgi:hypothetical protein